MVVWNPPESVITILVMNYSHFVFCTFMSSKRRRGVTTIGPSITRSTPHGNKRVKLAEVKAPSRSFFQPQPRISSPTPALETDYGHDIGSDSEEPQKSTKVCL